jgi:hypothetical protein
MSQSVTIFHSCNLYISQTSRYLGLVIRRGSDHSTNSVLGHLFVHLFYFYIDTRQRQLHVEHSTLALLLGDQHDAMPRSNSDNFGDIAADIPKPNDVPTENKQLEKRDLNTTGLPEGVSDNEREIEKKATSGKKNAEDPTASTTRKRRNKGDDKHGDERSEQEKEEEEKQKSLSFRDRLRSPLGSGIKLDELRETISNGVEVQYVSIVFSQARYLLMIGSLH